MELLDGTVLDGIKNLLLRHQCTFEYFRPTGIFLTKINELLGLFSLYLDPAGVLHQTVTILN